MYKQIIETFEPKPTFEEYFKNDDLTDYVNDDFMMNQCKNLTNKLIMGCFSLDKICDLVKDYQKKYIVIHKFAPHMSKKFSLQIWHKHLKITWESEEMEKVGLISAIIASKIFV